MPKAHLALSETSNSCAFRVDSEQSPHTTKEDACGVRGQAPMRPRYIERPPGMTAWEANLGLAVTAMVSSLGKCDGC